MRKILFALLSCLVLISACKEKTKEGSIIVKSENNFVMDSTEIRSTVTDFYTWYSKNYQRLMDYDLYDGIKSKDAPPYKINWEEVKRYQAYIKDSIPQLGTAFQDNMQELFRKSDSAFKVDLEEDVPYYFDFDWYTNTQEAPDYLLEEIQKAKSWDIKINGDDATVFIQGLDEKGTNPPYTVLNVKMKKENGSWKIAKTWTD
jgi:hypothetical protein